MHTQRLTGDALHAESIGVQRGLARSGDWLAVGARHAGSSDAAAGAAGRVYMFRRGADGLWARHQTIDAPDDGDVGTFGGAVALGGDTMLIGATGTSVAGDDGLFQGAAYFYRFDAGSDRWVLQQPARASDATIGAIFGASVALTGNTAAIVAASAPAPHFESAGAVYLWQRGVDGEWREVQKISPDGSRRLGAAVMTDGHFVVSSSGINRVYVYARDDDGLLADHVIIEPPVPDDAAVFGIQLSLHGASLLVGDHRALVNGIETGSAYLYDIGGSLNPTLVRRLNAPHWRRWSPGFGGGLFVHDEWIGVSSGALVIAADEDTWNDGYDRHHTGALYLYSRSDGTLRQVLTASDPGSVSQGAFSGPLFDGEQLFVGAPGAQIANQSLAGAVYVFASSAANPADISVAASVIPRDVFAGETTTFIAEITNQAGSEALGATLQFPILDDLEFIGGPPGCAETGALVLCDVGTVAPGGNAQVSLTVRAHGASFGDEGPNTAFITVFANQPDPNMLDNTVAKAVFVSTPEPDPPPPPPPPPPQRSGGGASSLAWVAFLLVGLLVKRARRHAT